MFVCKVGSNMVDMDQEGFNTILCRLCDKSISILEAKAHFQTLQALVNTSEIRDFTWTCNDHGIDLYTGIWMQLFSIWDQAALPFATKSEMFQTELSILSIWNYLVTLPEYDIKKAGQSERLSEAFLEKVLLRIVYASLESSSIFPVIKTILLHSKRLLHWVYKEKAEFRPKIRSLLGKYILTPNDELSIDIVLVTKPITAVSGTAALSVPILGRSSAVDAGSTMSHVAPLLDIVYLIIAGLSTTEPSISNTDVYTQTQATFFVQLLQDVLLPLHKPNQMVAWRDQIPVLQMYHEPLVRCVLKLTEKDSQLRRHARLDFTKLNSSILSSGSSQSVLVLATEGILGSWPDRFDTNTPKQVLLLHELEMLLEKASKKEFKFIKPNLLRRLVRCIGTDADNIRPAQRALQMFKNTKILDLFVGSAAGDEGGSVAMKEKAPSNESPEVLLEKALEEAVEVVDTLCVLLPALYRGGAQSWNPTVNKMTGLALKNLQARNEEAFKSCCVKLFSSRAGATSFLGFPVSAGAEAKVSARAASSSPLGATGAGGKLELTSIGEKVTSEFSAKSDASANTDADVEALNLMMQSMSTEAGAKGDGLASITSGGGSSGFPMPRGRPSRPPVAMHKATLPPTSTVAVNSSVATHAIAGGGAVNFHFDRSKPPPVTITGVAPWAVAGAGTGSGGGGGVTLPSGSTSTGITTTVMPPPSSRPMRPLGPRSTAPASNAPPNSLSCTIQEAKRARQEAGEHTVLAHHVSGGGGIEGDGYLRMSAYIEQCVPTTAPRTPEEEEAARLEDWQTIQAAASPTLLPSLRFHDLVFGTVLGEGAFSVVKYARHITKDKSQSAWPEYAVKIVQAAKIAELSYRASVVREMAVLQLLSHPGVARLVSAFRYSDSAYMVLEYAARGDLHTYLMKHGKVEHNYCRFIVGEIAAAVSFLHELGFSYGDLKPENVLITELGHIKITDFGACRPASSEAKELLSRSETILETIRNGDWREESPEARQQNPLSSNNNINNSVSTSSIPGDSRSRPVDAKGTPDDQTLDERLEGTPAYLPPEVLKKRVRLPGYIADAWALGCLTYFCLHGRPKYFGDAEQVLVQIEREAASASAAAATASESKSEHKSSGHVTFEDGKQSSGGDEGSSDCEDIAALVRNWEESAAEEFISALTEPDHRERMSVSQSMFHAYLSHGVPTSRIADLAHNRQEAATVRRTQEEMDCFPAPMDPQALHLLPPLKLPEEQLRSGAELADQQWSRRQFSVLWAPMPADYQLDDAAERKGAGGREGEGCTNADVWLMTHSYTLSAIEETSVERCSPFA